MDKMDPKERAMSISMSNGPSSSGMQKIYWTFVFLAIGIAAAVNVFNLALFRQRISAQVRGDRTAARPKNIIFQTQATIAAVVRELGYTSCRPLKFGKTTTYFPPFGPCILIGANLFLIITCWFYGLDPSNKKVWEKIGYRSFPSSD